jgi:hypothetical protein
MALERSNPRTSNPALMQPPPLASAELSALATGSKCRLAFELEALLQVSWKNLEHFAKVRDAPEIARQIFYFSLYELDKDSSGRCRTSLPMGFLS